MLTFGLYEVRKACHSLTEVKTPSERSAVAFPKLVTGHYAVIGS